MTRSLRLSVFALATLGLPLALAQQPPPGTGGTPPGGHGGTVVAAAGGKVEVCFLPDGVRLFVYDAKGAQVAPRGASGTVAVRFQGNLRRRNALNGAFNPAPGPGREPGFLQTGAMNLTRVPDGTECRANVELRGLAGGQTATFQADFRLARLIEYACPMQCVPAQAQPGECSRCHMALVAAPYVYACPTHANNCSRTASDRCWDCNAALVKRSDAGAGGAPGGGHGPGHGGPDHGPGHPGGGH